MNSVADLYLEKLLRQASTTYGEDAYFKLAHAEGACAVFRDMRMLTDEEDIEWRRRFRANYSNQKALQSSAQ